MWVGFVLRSHLAGVHIWFVTSRAGGPIHIKLIGRNPLGGHVGTDERDRCSPESAVRSNQVHSLGNNNNNNNYNNNSNRRQNESLQHRLPASEENHQEGVRELPYCGLSTLFLIHELQYQRFCQCQSQLSGGPEVSRRADSSTVRHPGRESSLSASAGKHIGDRSSGWPDVPLAKAEKGQCSTNSNKHSVTSGKWGKHLFPERWELSFLTQRIAKYLLFHKID